jgi:hypothetical protein
MNSSLSLILSSCVFLPPSVIVIQYRFKNLTGNIHRSPDTEYENNSCHVFVFAPDYVNVLEVNIELTPGYPDLMSLQLET